MTSQLPNLGQAGAALGNPPPAPEPGQAPRLQAREIGGGGAPRQWAIVLRGDDEVLSGLTDFARREDIQGGHFSGIGALQWAQLAYFDRGSGTYLNIPIAEQVECLSLNGTIGLVEGQPMLHVHCVVGYPDGSAKAGHVLKAVVWPTMEIFLTESAVPLPKTKDAESGLELFTFTS